MSRAFTEYLHATCYAALVTSMCTYCVCVATDRNDNMFAVCVNRAKPSGDDLVNALGSHIVPQSVLLCDGAKSYNKLAASLDCKKVELISHRMASHAEGTHR